MAKYVQCSACFKLNQAPTYECSSCGCSIGVKAFSEAHKISVFESGYYRDIDIEPVYIKNRKQLLDETRRRGQVSPYAEC